MDQQLQEFEERLGKQLSARFERIDQRFDTAGQRTQAVEATVKAGFADVAARFTQTDAKIGQLDVVKTRVESVNERVGALHEEAMAQFKISLEFLQGTKESLSKQFADRADSIESSLELVSMAVRANQAESLVDRSRRRS